MMPLEVKLLRNFKRFKPGAVARLTKGLALSLIKRGIAEPTDEESVPEYYRRDAREARAAYRRGEGPRPTANQKRRKKSKRSADTPSADGA